MKRFVMAFLLTLSIGGLYGCTTDPVKPSAPLQTDGESTPPPGCRDLRERGGAC